MVPTSLVTILGLDANFFACQGKNSLNDFHKTMIKKLEMFKSGSETTRMEDKD
jgi:hypothetical protein